MSEVTSVMVANRYGHGSRKYGEPRRHRAALLAAAVAAVSFYGLSHAQAQTYFPGSSDGYYTYNGSGTGPTQDAQLAYFGQFGARQGLNSTVNVSDFLTDPAGGIGEVLISGTGFVSLSNATNNFSGSVLVSDGNLLATSAVNAWGVSPTVSVQGGNLTVAGSSAYVGSATISIQFDPTTFIPGSTGSGGDYGGKYDTSASGILEINNTSDFGAGNATALANATINIAGGMIAQDNTQGTGQVNTLGTVNVYGGGRMLMVGSSTNVTTGLTISNLNLAPGATLSVIAQTTTNSTDLGSAFSQLHITNYNGSALANYGPNMIDPHITQYGYGQFLAVGPNGLQAAAFDQTLNGSSYTNAANCPTQIVNINFNPVDGFSGGANVSVLDSDINVAALRIGMAVGVAPDQNQGGVNNITLNSGAGTTINIGTNYAHAAGLIIQVSTAGSFGSYGSQVTVNPNLNFGTNEAVITVIDSGLGATDSSGKTGTQTADTGFLTHGTMFGAVLNGGFSAGSLTKGGNSSLYMDGTFNTPLSSVTVSEGELTVDGYGGGSSINTSFVSAVQNATLMVASGATVDFTYGGLNGQHGFVSFGGLGYVHNVANSMQLRNDVPTSISPGMGFSNTAGSAHPGILTFLSDPGASANTSLLYDLGAPNIGTPNNLWSVTPTTITTTSDEIVMQQNQWSDAFTLGGNIKVNPLKGFGPGTYALITSGMGFQVPDFGYSLGDYSGATSTLLQSASGAYLPSSFGAYPHLYYSTAFSDGGTELDLIVTTYDQNIAGNAGQWSAHSGGTWNQGTNWAGSTPAALGDTATFGTNLTSSGNITLANSPTVSNLNFNNASHSYTIAASGTNALTLDGGPSPALVNVLAGSHTITAPVNVGAIGADFVFANNAGLTVGNVSGASGVPLAVRGAGTLTIPSTGSLPTGAVLNIGGAATVQVNGASLTLSALNANGILALNNATVTVESSGFGFTTISTGTLISTGSSVLHTGPDNYSQINNLSGSGNLTIDNNCSWNGYQLQGNYNYTGALTMANSGGGGWTADYTTSGVIPNLTVDVGSVNSYAYANFYRPSEFNASSVVVVKSGNMNLYVGGSDVQFGSLSGAGTVNTDGGAVVPGRIHPGLNGSSGVLTINGGVTLHAGSTLDLTLGAGVSDSQLVVNGLLTLDSTGTVNLSLANAVVGNSYDVISYGSYSGPTGTGGDITSDFNITGLSSGETAVVTETGTGGGYIDVTIVGSSSVNATWSASVGGVWGTSSNWSPTNVPTTAGDTATFASAIGANSTVTLQATHTVGTLNFNNPTYSYTLEASGSNVLALDSGTTSAAVVNVINGSHTVNAPIALTNYGVNIAFSNSSSLTVGGAMTTPTTNGAAIAVNGTGTLTIATTGSLPANSSLSIDNNATVALAINHGNSGLGLASLTTLSSLNIGTGTLDLGNNALMINYGTNTSPLPQIAAWVASGQNNPNADWSGTGITSSFAANTIVSAGNNVYVGVGYNEASTIASVAGATTFLGANIDTSSTAVLVVPTLYGDILLQGTVGLLDVSIFSANFNQSTSLGWAQGDFYDQGTVGLPDYSLFLDNFGYSLTGYPAVTPAQYAEGEAILNSLLDAHGTSVPEPASLSLLALGAGALLARRRRGAKA